MVGLATLTVAAIAASILAFGQKRQADRNSAQSRSRELSSVARSTMGEEPGLAALLAVEANYPNGATTPNNVADARITLGVTLRNLQWSTFTRVGPRITAPATHIVHADARHLMTINRNRCTCGPTWWDAKTGRRVGRPVSAKESKRLLAPFGTFAAGPAGSIMTGPLRLGDRQIIDPFTVDQTSGMVIGTDPGTADLLVQPDRGGPAVSRLIAPPGVTLTFVVSLPAGQVVAATTDGDLYEWSRTAGGQARRLDIGVKARSVGAAGGDRIVVESYDIPSELEWPTDPCSRVCNPQPVLPSSDVDAARIDIVDISDPSRPAIRASLAQPAATRFASFTLAPTSAQAPRYLAAISAPTNISAEGQLQQVYVWDLDDGRLVASIPRLQPTDLRWLTATTLAGRVVAGCRGIPGPRPVGPDGPRGRPRRLQGRRGRRDPAGCRAGATGATCAVTGSTPRTCRSRDTADGTAGRRDPGPALPECRRPRRGVCP